MILQSELLHDYSFIEYLNEDIFRRFIDSEADLDSAIKSLLPRAQSPALAYPELIKSGAVAKLIGLMSHENADIMIDVVQLIHELLDEDAAAGDEDDDEDEGEGREGAVKALVDALVFFEIDFAEGRILISTIA